MARQTPTRMNVHGVRVRQIHCLVYYNATSNPATYYGQQISSVVRDSQGVHTVTFRDPALKVIGVQTGFGLSAAVAGAGVQAVPANQGTSSPLAVTVKTFSAAATSVDPAAHASNFFSVALTVEDSSAG